MCLSLIVVRQSYTIGQTANLFPIVFLLLQDDRLNFLKILVFLEKATKEEEEEEEEIDSFLLLLLL